MGEARSAQAETRRGLFAVPRMPAPLQASWTIDEEQFPATGDSRDKLLFLLRYAVLAPSIYNTQPWRFAVAGDTIDLMADRSRALAALDPHGREQIMSCGAALKNLQVAAHFFGYSTRLQAFPDRSRPDWIARLRLQGGKSTDSGDRDLFRAITMARVNDAPFDDERPSIAFLLSLRQHAVHEGCELAFAECPGMRTRLETLIVEGDRWQRCQQALMAERRSWVRDSAQDCSDGITVDSPVRLVPAPTLGVPVWSIENCRLAAAVDQAQAIAQTARAAPVLAVLGTPGDTPRDWLDAGRTWQHLSLAARHSGVWLAPLSQALQVPVLRRQVRRLALSQGWPQQVFRLGFGPEVKPMPRRCVDAVVIKPPQPWYH